MQISAMALLLATGCSSMKAAKRPDGLPLRYHNERYNLTFYLPASWQGYSVSIQQDKPMSPIDAYHCQHCIVVRDIGLPCGNILPNGSVFRSGGNSCAEIYAITHCVIRHALGCAVHPFIAFCTIWKTTDPTNPFPISEFDVSSLKGARMTGTGSGFAPGRSVRSAAASADVEKTLDFPQSMIESFYGTRRFSSVVNRQSYSFK